MEAFESGSLNQAHMVGERSVGLRRCAVRHAGGIRSANADMSSDKAGTPLLREHAVKNCIEGSNPSLSAKYPSLILKSLITL